MMAQGDKCVPPSLRSFPVSAAPHVGFLMSSEESEAVLDAKVAANLACFKWLRHRSALLAKNGFLERRASSAEMGDWRKFSMLRMFRRR